MAGGLTKRTLIACVLALVVGLVAGIGVVSAKRAAEIETDLLFFYTGPDILNGLVTSPEPDCMRHRKVSIKKRGVERDRTLAKVNTGGDRFFEKHFNHDVRGGVYFSKTKSKQISAGLCGPAASLDTTVPEP